MIFRILGKNPRAHPKYEFYEFLSYFQPKARFENHENHIEGEFRDI